MQKGNIRLRASAIILDPKNRLLLVNHVKKGRSYWLFPGGGVEYGEDPKEALLRELWEELGIRSATVKNLVFVNSTIYPGNSRHILNIHFNVKIADYNGMKVSPEGPLKTAAFVTPAKFAKLLFYPAVKSDILTWWKKGFSECKGYIDIKWKK